MWTLLKPTTFLSMKTKMRTRVAGTSEAVVEAEEAEAATEEAAVEEVEETSTTLMLPEAKEEAAEAEEVEGITMTTMEVFGRMNKEKQFP